MAPRQTTSAHQGRGTVVDGGDAGMVVVRPESGELVVVVT